MSVRTTDRRIETGTATRPGTILALAILLVFEVVELFMVPFHPVMHPLLIGMAVAIIALASTRSARRFLVARA
jgi:hypothetical protein